jgi:hypothetical protein
MLNLKQIELAFEEKKALSFCCLNQQKLFIYQSKKNINNYFLLSNKLNIKINQNNLYFNNFNNNFLKFIKNNDKEYSRKLILKGLGFRINYIEESNALRFKLGLSHSVDIKIPLNNIYAIIKKNTIHITGANLSYIGNFCQKIRNLKKKNAYNGKGFFLKNEKIICKVYKKNK